MSFLKNITIGHWGQKKFSQLGLHHNDGIELVFIRRGRVHWELEENYLIQELVI
ncbi:MAG: hypothetical protein MK193_08195 [Lentisphaeria bacterium]|nr:hypothetical protein [Lentisphaeria bacterium]